ncbi:hypothetical protein [Micromonospora phytophila]|nr:hypothetical protein [Micromonospora phytophila]
MRVEDRGDSCLDVGEGQLLEPGKCGPAAAGRGSIAANYFGR